MPHLHQPPNDIASILATAEPDPEWLAALEASPIPAGTDYGTDPIEAMALLKNMGKATYPRQKALLDASRPSGVVEIDIDVHIPGTDLVPTSTENRVILCHPNSSQAHASSSSANKLPVVILFHGGGHSLGNPEQELPLARLLVQKFNTLVILPSYRLAPEHPFPASFNDCFEILKQVAIDLTLSTSAKNTSMSIPRPQIVPATLLSQVDAKLGFIVGGTSAGSTIAASISYLYHTHRSSSQAHHLPPLTGLFLSCGSSLNVQRIPARYQSVFLSHEQNRKFVPLDDGFYQMVLTALKPRYDAPLMTPMDQHPELDIDRSTLPAEHSWLKGSGVRVYFQACGMDMNRDHTLVYERMLREEVGVETHLDLYTGFGHCFWGMSGIYAELDMTRKRILHTVEGIGWLLRLNQETVPQPENL